MPRTISPSPSKRRQSPLYVSHKHSRRSSRRDRSRSPYPYSRSRRFSQGHEDASLTSSHIFTKALWQFFSPAGTRAIHPPKDGTEVVQHLQDGGDTSRKVGVRQSLQFGSHKAQVLVRQSGNEFLRELARKKRRRGEILSSCSVLLNLPSCTTYLSVQGIFNTKVY
eukprot:Gb_40205 [translate_table: standard]